MSLNMAILKVLSSYPNGLATAAALKADLAILSGSADWTTRMRSLAARMPNLDVFSRKFVVREGRGWRITAEGRAMLDRLEGRHTMAIEAQGETQLFAAAMPQPVQVEADDWQIDVQPDILSGEFPRPQLKVIQGGKSRSRDQIRLAIGAGKSVAMRP